MNHPQTARKEHPAAEPRAPQNPPARQAGGDTRPPVLARSDTSEPAELAPVVVRGYN